MSADTFVHVHSKMHHFVAVVVSYENYQLKVVEIFGQTSKYAWVEFRSMGVGLVLHMIDMI